MRITVNLDTQAVITQPSPLRFKAGCFNPVEVAFTRGSQSASLPEGSVIEFALKPRNQWTGGLLAYLNAFTPSAGGVYTGMLNCASVAMLAALGRTDQATANDIAQIDASAEVTWSFGGQKFRSVTFPATIESPVADDNPAATPNPELYPLPGAILTTSNIATEAEVEAGASADKLVTPATLAHTTASYLRSDANTAYVSKNGDDTTAAIGSPSNPFLTTQAAFDAVYARWASSQVNQAQHWVMQFGVGVWEGVTLGGRDWPVQIVPMGSGASVSFLGGIRGDGADGANSHLSNQPGWICSAIPADGYAANSPDGIDTIGSDMTSEFTVGGVGSGAALELPAGSSAEEVASLLSAYLQNTCYRPNEITGAFVGLTDYYPFPQVSAGSNSPYFEGRGAALIYAEPGESGRNIHVEGALGINLGALSTSAGFGGQDGEYHREGGGGGIMTLVDCIAESVSCSAAHNGSATFILRRCIVGTAHAGTDAYGSIFESTVGLCELMDGGFSIAIEGSKIAAINAAYAEIQVVSSEIGCAEAYSGSMRSSQIATLTLGSGYATLSDCWVGDVSINGNEWSPSTLVLTNCTTGYAHGDPYSIITLEGGICSSADAPVIINRELIPGIPSCLVCPS